MSETKGTYWRKMDNAAKLFSAASNKKDTRVFRFYCELKEEIVEEYLQKALEKTVEKYPTFLSVMRKGLFWHYLEKSNQHPIVREEYREPCSSLYIHDKKNLLFEVTYYKRRINFEVFHALTDGTGASEFIRELAKNYVLTAHAEEALPDIELSDETISVSEHEDDGFAKYYSKDVKKEKKKRLRAHQIRRTRRQLGAMQVTEAEIPVAALAKKAKEYGVSMTVFLTAAFMCAIHGKMSRRQEEKPVVLMVPVNLRKFFPSNSMLNFFNWIEPGYHFGQGKDDFAQVVARVKEIFGEELTAEKMAQRMNEYFALEVNPILRLAPLELKNFCINAGSRSSEKEVTAIFSNMGIIKMPPEYEPYIERFGVYTSTPKLEMCMCSFRENVYLGFTSRFDCAMIKNNFFRILSEQGLSVKVLDVEYPGEQSADTIGMKVYKIFTFLCIIAVVAALGTDYSMDRHFGVSLLVCGGALSMWLALSVAFFKRNNLLKNAMWQLLVVTAGCALWDKMTGWRGWSVNYVFPAVSVGIMTSMLVIARIYYRRASEYMIYLVMASGYGILFPFLFLLTGLATVTFPSVVSIGMAVILLAALILFKGDEFREEMEKKFHV